MGCLDSKKIYIFSPWWFRKFCQLPRILPHPPLLLISFYLKSFHPTPPTHSSYFFFIFFLKSFDISDLTNTKITTYVSKLHQNNRLQGIKFVCFCCCCFFVFFSFQKRSSVSEFVHSVQEFCPVLYFPASFNFTCSPVIFKYEVVCIITESWSLASDLMICLVCGWQTMLISNTLCTFLIVLCNCGICCVACVCVRMSVLIRPRCGLKLKRSFDWNLRGALTGTHSPRMQ